MQNTELRHTELRPLGAGELLDRAVTLFVREFVPIVIVLAAVLVPLVVFQAIAAPKSGQVFSDLGRVFSAAGNRAASQTAAEALSRDSASNGITALLFIVGFVARLLMWSAIVSLVATAYAGSRISFGSAYRLGLGRWLQQMVIALTFTVIGMLTSIPLVIAYLLVAIVIGVLAGLNQFAAAVVVGVIGGLIVFAAIAVVLSWVFMTYQIASVAVVTETSNPIDAIGAALRRGFARGIRWRMVVGGLVVFVVSQAGAWPLLAVAAVLTAMTHVNALYFAILGVGSVLLEGIVAAFVVVFAVDIRVRREGFDLIAAEPPPAPL
ncbi:MAG: hypothetical protein M3N49_15310 [Candidatus Eremiobacteraeota bacterium]|nr:hypothetical protein [Candidatus Eremiobacteraeota bacterium]